MNREYGDAHYTSCVVEDIEQGSTGLDLMRVRRHGDGSKERIARILFWDACGQFYIETFGTDVPLVVLEALIAEAKETIKVR